MQFKSDKPFKREIKKSKDDQLFLKINSSVILFIKTHNYLDCNSITTFPEVIIITLFSDNTEEKIIQLIQSRRLRFSYKPTK
jgi:hypothetical protein